jgi:hypothetical protein
MRQARLRDKAPGYRPIIAYVLSEPVRALLDPQGRGRQHVAARLVQLTGTNPGGFVLCHAGHAREQGNRMSPSDVSKSGNWWRTQSNANRSPNRNAPNWEKYWEKRTNCRDSHREIQKTPVAWALLRILSSKNKWERDSRKWEARRNKWEDSQYLNVPANDRANASATLRANRVERPLAANKVILL